MVHFPAFASGRRPSAPRSGIQILLLTLLAVVGLAAVGCGPAQSSKGAHERGRLAETKAKPGIESRKVKVVATVGMISDAVKNVGGDRAEAIALMGPGVDPHVYKATASDVDKLGSADIIFYGGLELEGRMTEIFEKMAGSGTAAVAVSQDVPEDGLRQPKEFEGKYDPHIWFDVTLWKHAVRTVAAELSKLDPNSATTYQANGERYLRALDELHEYVRSQVAKIPKEQRVLVTAHDAFGYFGQRYGFEVLGVQGTSTATEAGAGDVQRLAQVIAERRIKAIFVESSVPTATIEALQKAVRSRGWRVKIGGQLFSDAMGEPGSPEGTYIGMVRHNVDTLVDALK